MVTPVRVVEASTWTAASAAGALRPGCPTISRGGRTSSHMSCSSCRAGCAVPVSLKRRPIRATRLSVWPWLRARPVLRSVSCVCQHPSTNPRGPASANRELEKMGKRRGERREEGASRPLTPSCGGLAIVSGGEKFYWTSIPRLCKNIPRSAARSCSAKSAGVVAQLVRAPACHAGGRGFDPRPSRHQTSKGPGAKSFWPFFVSRFSLACHLANPPFCKVPAMDLPGAGLSRRFLLLWVGYSLRVGGQGVRSRAARKVCRV